MGDQHATKSAISLDKTDTLPILLWASVVFLTWLFMHGADHFLEMSAGALGKYYDLRWILIAHITGGGGALVLGLLQFWKKLRIYSWRLHRLLGFLYLLAILLSSICAVILAFSTAYEVSWAYAFSLQIWVGVWISSTLIAYYAAVKRRFQLHQQWMVRSYLVTLAFIVSGLALKIPYVQNLGTFSDVSPSLFWMGWSVPLYIYQVMLGMTPQRKPNV